MGKGCGRRRKQLWVEEAENDSMHVGSTRWQGIAVKNMSVCWVVRFGIPVSPEKSLSIVTVFHPAPSLCKRKTAWLPGNKGSLFPHFLTTWIPPRAVAFLYCQSDQVTSFWLHALLSGTHTSHRCHVPSFVFVFSCNFHITGHRYNVLRECGTTCPL